MLLRTILFEMWLRNSAGLHCELDSLENKFRPGCDRLPGNKIRAGSVHVGLACAEIRKQGVRPCDTPNQL